MSPLARFVRDATLVVATGLALAGCRGGERFPAGTPVLLVTIDTLRSDRLAIYGHAGGRAPHFDALAREAVVFERAYAPVPLTLPSHVSLLTGRLPPEHGVRDNLGYTLDPARQPTLAALLAARGYATGGFVSAFVLRGATGVGAGFATFDDAIERREGQGLGNVERAGPSTVAAALGWLDAHAVEPFFLFVHLFEPHAPYEPPEPFRSAIADPYLGEIAAADAALGTLLDGLRARGLYDRALVVVAGDHGEGLGDHGESEHGILLYREALEVPLLLKLPGGERGGVRLASPVGLVDVFPTIARGLDLPVPAGLPGSDLLGAIDDSRTLYAETLYPRLHLGWSELRSAVAGPLHYIEGPDPELYDVVADPAERANVLDARRRERAALAGALAAIPLAFATPAAAASEEESKKLAALGYLTAGPVAEGTGPRPDPKREIGVLEELRRALELSQHGRFAESNDACRRILARHPQIADARLRLAWNLTRLGELDAAAAEYREVVRRAPHQLTSVALDLARLELERGDLDAARSQAELARRDFPRDAGLLLGEVALARGDAAAAVAAADAALAGAAAPGPVAALFLRGRAEATQGRFPEAIATLAQARDEIDAGRAAPLPGLEATAGDLLARAGRAAEAEAAFRREIARFPENAAAYPPLAYLLAAEGRFAEIRPLLDAMVAARPVAPTYALAAETARAIGDEAGAAAYERAAVAARAASRVAPAGSSRAPSRRP